MTTLKIDYDTKTQEEMPTGKWFFARKRLTNEIQVVQRVEWSILNAYSNCVIYMTADHLQFDTFNTFLANWEILDEVSEIEVR
jgi:hypothetical protein